MCGVCSRFSYLIAGADVNAIFQEVEDFVNVSRPGSPKETGVAVGLDNRGKQTERGSVRKSDSRIPLKCMLKTCVEIGRESVGDGSEQMVQRADLLVST